MNLPKSLHRRFKDRLLNTVLAPHVDAFVEHLSRGRYAPNTVDRYLGCIAHLARWLWMSSVAAENIDEASVIQFLDDHIPGCDCPRPAPRVLCDLRAACGHLLHVLRDRGAVAEPALPTGPIADELRCFDEHMRQVRGLAAKTRSARIRIVDRLLQQRFASGPVVIAELRPGEIRQFIADQLEHCGTASNAGAVASALRAYFRYRTTCGDRVHGLAGVVCSPAHWSLASLPRSLSTADTERLLASFTSDLPSPRRGYAMVRCALDMGLRASEIATLALTDIDWHNGTVTLRRTKSRRQDMVPLPAVTGRAIVEYLRHERPATINPAVFVRRHAPHDVPIGVDAVRRVIRDAYRRIGLTHTRTHALRHTLARRLLEHGSSLKEVADVLRHRSLNTSLIYAKLDSCRLAAVALPWPGSAA